MSTPTETRPSETRPSGTRPSGTGVVDADGEPIGDMEPSREDLTGRVGLVTGASSGVGRAVCANFVRRGGRVAALARRGPRLRELRDEVGEALVPIDCDVRDFGGLEAAAEAAATALGPLDCIVANAGVSDASQLTSGDPTRWWRVIETNLLGTMATIRAASPYLKTVGPRDVVIVGSLSSTVAHPAWPAYASSKAGIAMTAECLRQELVRQDVRVSLIEFGQVETEIREMATVQEGVDVLSPLRIVPEMMKRIAPQEIAETILFVVTRPQGVHINRIVIRPSGCVS